MGMLFVIIQYVPINSIYILLKLQYISLIPIVFLVVNNKKFNGK